MKRFNKITEPNLEIADIMNAERELGARKKLAEISELLCDDERLQNLSPSDLVTAASEAIEMYEPILRRYINMGGDGKRLIEIALGRKYHEPVVEVVLEAMGHKDLSERIAAHGKGRIQEDVGQIDEALDFYKQSGSIRRAYRMLRHEGKPFTAKRFLEEQETTVMNNAYQFNWFDDILWLTQQIKPEEFDFVKKMAYDHFELEVLPIQGYLLANQLGDEDKAAQFEEVFEAQKEYQ